jgi:outer membrane protein
MESDMDRFKYGWMLVAVLWLCTPAQAQEFTMEQAVEHALKGNPSVESKLLTLEQAKMNIGVAQSYFWPRVSLVSSNNRLENSGAAGSTDDLSSRSWSRGVRVNLSLFAGFAHLNNLDKSRLSVDMEEARHRQAKLELIANVQLQFLQLLKAREDLKSAKESITRIETQLKAAEAFVKVGMAPYVNVLQNQVELSKAKQQEIRVQNTIRNAEVQLNKYLNYSPDEPILYTGDLRDFSGVVSYTDTVKHRVLGVPASRPRYSAALI